MIDGGRIDGGRSVGMTWLLGSKTPGGMDGAVGEIGVPTPGSPLGLSEAC